jgi:hypothetical protein
VTRNDGLSTALLLLAACSSSSAAPSTAVSDAGANVADASSATEDGSDARAHSNPVPEGGSPSFDSGALADTGPVEDGPAGNSLDAAGSSNDASTTAVDGLLAYDGMGTQTGDVSSFGVVVPNPVNNYGLAPGFGWCDMCGWSLYGETPQVGQAEVSSTSLLTFPSLLTTGYRMLHHTDVQGRMLDVPGAFGDYQVMDSSGTPLIGKPGTSVWLSLLVRLEGTVGDTPVFLTTHSDQAAWHAGEAIWSAGLRTTADWSLFPSGYPPAPDGNPPTNRVSTGKTYKAGTTNLLVLRFDFAATGATIALFVDPAVGPASPSSADATLDLPTALTFRDFAFSASGPDVSFDEIRFGKTFASVTPMH